MQECRVSHCLASAHIPGLADLQRIQTLQKFVQNRDDTDKESVSNRCGHCGAFVFRSTQKPINSIPTTTGSKSISRRKMPINPAAFNSASNFSFRECRCSTS